MVATVVTWNVQWATPRSQRSGELVARIFGHRPDIVCLTETDATLLDDRSGYVIRSRPDGIMAKQTNSRRKVLLWSKEPWTEIDDQGHGSMPPGRFVSGTTKTTALGKVTVVGVCVPYRESRTRWTNDGVHRRPWDDHVQYLEGLRPVLDRIAKRLVVLGDFNQRTEGSYPTRVRQALHAAFPPGAMIATGGLGEERRSIDHVAISDELSAHSLKVISRYHGGKALSDHHGVAADLVSCA